MFDKDDIPYVYPSRAHKNNRPNDESNNINNKASQVGQVVMSIDKRRWKDIIDVFDITEAKIKRDGDEEDITTNDSLKTSHYKH